MGEVGPTPSTPSTTTCRRATRWSSKSTRNISLKEELKGALLLTVLVTFIHYYYIYYIQPEEVGPSFLLMSYNTAFDGGNKSEEHRIPPPPSIRETLCLRHSISSSAEFVNVISGRIILNCKGLIKNQIAPIEAN